MVCKPIEGRQKFEIIYIDRFKLHLVYDLVVKRKKKKKLIIADYHLIYYLPIYISIPVSTLKMCLHCLSSLICSLLLCTLSWPKFESFSFTAPDANSTSTAIGWVTDSEKSCCCPTLIIDIVKFFMGLKSFQLLLLLPHIHFLKRSKALFWL